MGSDALGRATNAEDQALGDVEEGEKSLITLQGTAAGATAVEADAATKLAAAQDVADQAANFLASETERLDEEKATLEEVVTLIDTLAASAALQVANRQLLSIVDLSSLANADPTAVAEVKQLLLDLISKLKPMLLWSRSVMQQLQPRTQPLLHIKMPP